MGASPAAAQQPPAAPQMFIAPSGEPFRAAPGEAYPSAAWFAGADADRDGQLTRAEFLADAGRYFTVLDSDRSGQLEAAEVDAYEAGVLAPLSRRTGPPRGAGAPLEARKPPLPGSPKGAGGFGLINSPHPVKAADRDLNSKVTQAEWARTLGDRYTMLEKGETGTGSGPLKLEALPKTPVQLALGPKR
jgi:hypothetical protein